MCMDDCLVLGAIREVRTIDLFVLVIVINTRYATKKWDLFPYVRQHVVDKPLIEDLQYSPTTKNLLVRLKDSVTR